MRKSSTAMSQTGSDAVARNERQTGCKSGTGIGVEPWAAAAVEGTVSGQWETETLELNEVEQLKAELRRVKRELEVVQQERDILKKQWASSRTMCSDEIPSD